MPVLIRPETVKFFLLSCFFYSTREATPKNKTKCREREKVRTERRHCGCKVARIYMCLFGGIERYPIMQLREPCYGAVDKPLNTRGGGKKRFPLELRLPFRCSSFIISRGMKRGGGGGGLPFVMSRPFRRYIELSSIFLLEKSYSGRFEDGGKKWRLNQVRWCGQEYIYIYLCAFSLLDYGHVSIISIP